MKQLQSPGIKLQVLRDFKVVCAKRGLPKPVILPLESTHLPVPCGSGHDQKGEQVHERHHGCRQQWPNRGLFVANLCRETPFRELIELPRKDPKLIELHGLSSWLGPSLCSLLLYVGLFNPSLASLASMSLVFRKSGKLQLE